MPTQEERWRYVRHFSIAAGLACALVVPAQTHARVERICLDDTATDGVVEQLNRTLGASGLAAVRQRTGCTFHLGFVARGSAVFVLLQTPSGRKLDRRVPWLETPDRALIESARQGRLAPLVVLVQGLVAEHLVAEHLVAEHLVAEHLVAEHLVDKHLAAGRTRSLASAPRSAARRDRAAARRDRAAARRDRAAARRDRAASPKKDEPKLVLPHPVADQPDAAGEVVAVDDQLVPTLSTIVSSPEPPKSRRWPWKLETSLDGWIRPGSSPRLGFRGALAWGPMVAEISYRPAATLETASTRAIGGAVGAECNLYASRWLLLDLRGVVDFERQSAVAASAPFPPNSPMPSPDPKEGPQPSPAPPPNNPEHTWMVGPAASVRLGVPIVLGMRVGISLDVRWMFATELLANNPAWSQGLDLGAAFFAGWAI